MCLRGDTLTLSKVCFTFWVCYEERMIGSGLASCAGLSEGLGWLVAGGCIEIWVIMEDEIKS